MSKKIIVAFLMVFMVVAVVGCGAQEKMEDKIAESVTEGIINKALDGEGKVDLDGDEFTIKGDDGQEYSFGETEWPADGAAKQIPQLKKGVVVSSMNSETFCMLVLEEIEKDDFNRYFEEVKSQGFTNDSFEMNNDLSFSYSAYNDENTMISLMYDAEAKSVTINCEISE